jgi:peptide/nickel transport system ATP-binding protein
VLEIYDLRIEFNTFEGTAKIINGINLVIGKNEVVGLVGESGCGKTITAKAILGILPTPPARITRGKIILNNVDLLSIPKEKAQTLRKKELFFIPQDPTSSLNPMFSIGQQMVYMKKYKGSENFSLLKFIINSFRDGFYKEEIKNSIEFLKKVEIADPERVIRCYPFQLSGGMRQRVWIAMALMSTPSLLILDEPTTNLDVSIQDQILELLENKVKEHESSVLYITHDLGVARRLCNRIYVLYAGDIVESGDIQQIFERPEHPYTKELLQAVPKIYGEMSSGTFIGAPNYYNPPSGCRFSSRCKYKMPICEKEKPKLKVLKASQNHVVACHLFDGAKNE